MEVLEELSKSGVVVQFDVVREGSPSLTPIIVQ